MEFLSCSTTIRRISDKESRMAWFKANVKYGFIVSIAHWFIKSSAYWKGFNAEKTAVKLLLFHLCSVWGNTCAFEHEMASSNAICVLGSWPYLHVSHLELRFLHCLIDTFENKDHILLFFKSKRTEKLPNFINFIAIILVCFRFDEVLIHTACGILEVNSFEVRCPSGSTVQGLYPQTAIMSHNCVPNTSHCIISSEENRYWP